MEILQFTSFVIFHFNVSFSLCAGQLNDRVAQLGDVPPYSILQELKDLAPTHECELHNTVSKVEGDSPFRFVHSTLDIILGKASAKRPIVCEQCFLGSTLTSLSGRHPARDWNRGGILRLGGDVRILL